MIDQEKLLRALKAKFKRPRDVLRALGLDAAMMPDNGVGNGNGRGELRDLMAGLRRLADESDSLRRSDHRKIVVFLDTNKNSGKGPAEIRSEIERLLQECNSLDSADQAEFIKYLDERAPFDRRDDDDHEPAADRSRARGRDDEPVDIKTALGKIRKFLKEDKKWTDDAIAEAMPLFRRNIEQGGGDAVLRRNAMRGGVGGLAVHAMDSAKEMFGDNLTRVKVDLTASELASLARLAPGHKRIRTDTSPMRRPTAREAASFDRLFPEASRIREGCGR
jgi:hypothetical protein